MGHDVKAIEDMDGLAGLPDDDAFPAPNQTRKSGMNRELT